MWFRVALAAFVLSAMMPQTAAAQATSSYYCDLLRAYYPAAATCPEPWRVVNSAPMPSVMTTQSGIAQRPGTGVPSGFAPLGDGFDDFCQTVTLPRTIALCSDRELRSVAVERQQAFDEARARLTPDQQKALLADQKEWTGSYSQACGLAAEGPISLPLAPTVQRCMAASGRARITYLRAYGAPHTGEGTKAADQLIGSRPPDTVMAANAPSRCDARPYGARDMDAYRYIIQTKPPVTDDFLAVWCGMKYEGASRASAYKVGLSDRQIDGARDTVEFADLYLAAVDANAKRAQMVAGAAPNTSASSSGEWGFWLVIGLIVLYFLPTLNAVQKGRGLATFVANVFFGWTIVGWLIILIWSLTPSSKPTTVIIRPDGTLVR